MEDTLSLFNRLTRPRMTPSGLPNHWVFGVRHAPLQSRDGDVVVVVHPYSNFSRRLRNGLVLFASNASEKARALLPLLLSAFVLREEFPGSPQPVDPLSFAPWTWATEDPELAKALESCLSQRGFVNELCRVGICSQSQKDILEAIWSPTYRKLIAVFDQGGLSASLQPYVVPGDNTRCHGCGMSGKIFLEPLKKCSACGKAWYHSQGCPRKHWKQHKPECLANRPGNTTTPDSSILVWAPGRMIDALLHYHIIARSSPEAQALMRTMYLSFPSSLTEGDHVSFSKAFRSLIYTGKDTPQNMQTMFGPHWRTSFGTQYETTRLDILIDPPRGSISVAMFRNVRPDSRLERSPRPATDAEQQTLGKVREMQDAIQRRMTELGGPLREGDKEAIIRSSYGPDWAQHVPKYGVAVFTSDVGARF